MSVCPTVSVLRFYGCCHPCLVNINVLIKITYTDEKKKVRNELIGYFLHLSTKVRINLRLL